MRQDHTPQDNSCSWQWRGTLLCGIFRRWFFKEI